MSAQLVIYTPPTHPHLHQNGKENKTTAGTSQSSIDLLQ